MRQLFMYVCIVCTLLLFPSCENALVAEDSSEPSSNLRVTVFSIEKTPFGILTRAAKSVSEVCTRLNFVIYNIGGTRVKQTNQIADDKNFGKASSSWNRVTTCWWLWGA